MSTPTVVEHAENLRRTVERMLATAVDGETAFIDALQHLLDTIAQLKKELHG